jgi:hypothetical protein
MDPGVMCVAARAPAAPARLSTSAMAIAIAPARMCVIDAAIDVLPCLGWVNQATVALTWPPVEHFGKSRRPTV